jgi:predicted transcriptional regulator
MAENTPDKPKIIFYPDRAGLHKFWGKLESEILEIIWDNGPMTVKRALFFINHDHSYAYTTIMTVMNNLVKREILNREKKGHSFFYSPIMEKDEFLSYAITKIMTELSNEYNPQVSAILAGIPGSVKKNKGASRSRKKKEV